MKTAQTPLPSGFGFESTAQQVLGGRPYPIDRALAEQLWARSEAWTGVKFAA